MKHLFVPYELALKLKEKGFDEPCFYRYNHHGSAKPDPKWDGKLINNRKWERFGDYDDCVSAPLYQQVVDWFREVHDVNIWLTPSLEKKSLYKAHYSKRFKAHYTTFNILTESSYYEALSEAIELALKQI